MLASLNGHLQLSQYIELSCLICHYIVLTLIYYEVTIQNQGEVAKCQHVQFVLKNWTFD